MRTSTPYSFLPSFLPVPHTTPHSHTLSPPFTHTQTETTKKGLASEGGRPRKPAAVTESSAQRSPPRFSFSCNATASPSLPTPHQPKPAPCLLCRVYAARRHEAYLSLLLLLLLLLPPIFVPDAVGGRFLCGGFTAIACWRA